jgi:nucleoside-diphosphate-sugar epimerase
MEALVTGATGKVGHAVASALLERDASKAVRDLGWEPTRLDEGLRATLAGMGLA